MSDLVCDALYAIIREAQTPPVDTNRLYLTGLSYGGSAAYTFPFGYPGRFAASVPAAGFATANCVPDDKPCNFWYFYNEHENATKVRQQLIADIARAITERGGEYRVSTFPDKGHNVWDKTWREEAVWDWVFSKTADGQPVTLLPGATKPVLFLQGAVCTAAKPGRNAGASPKRAADGLNATCYVSATPVTQGDWWRVDFATPISGNIAVKSGYSDGKGRVTAASVETSTDGASWTPCGQFSPADGACRFETEEPIKHLRVVSESPTGEILVLREVEVAP